VVAIFFITTSYINFFPEANANERQITYQGDGLICRLINRMRKQYMLRCSVEQDNPEHLSAADLVESGKINFSFISDPTILTAHKNIRAVLKYPYNGDGIIIASETEDEHTVYDFVKIISESYDLYEEAGKGFYGTGYMAKKTEMPQVRGMPLHKGAEKFYKEFDLIK